MVKYNHICRGGQIVKTKIATVGSCVTRDNFNTKFNPNYKMFFDLVLHQHQVALPSLMSKNIPYIADSTVDKLPDFGKWHLKTECNKEFLELIKEKNPEYLIMDLDGDVHFGVSQIDENNYFTNNPKFSDISFLNKYENKFLLKDDPDKYFELWQPKVDVFFDFLQREVPNCKVILVKARFTDTLKGGESLTELRKEKNLKTLDVPYMNKLWDRLDDYIIRKFDVEVIDMTQKDYYLNRNHPWGAFYLHYTNEFYNDFLNKLQHIVMCDNQKKLDNVMKINNDLEDRLKKVSIENNSLLSRLDEFENESLLKLIKRKTMKIS